MLASFCDNILKKGGSEKLSDEAIEDTLDKVPFFFSDILVCFCQTRWLVMVFFNL